MDAQRPDHAVGISAVRWRSVHCHASSRRIHIVWVGFWLLFLQISCFACPENRVLRTDGGLFSALGISQEREGGFDSRPSSIILPILLSQPSLSLSLSRSCSNLLFSLDLGEGSRVCLCVREKFSSSLWYYYCPFANIIVDY